MAPRSERATSVAARLEGAVALDLVVQETYEVTKGIRELTLEGDLAGFSPWPGQDVMVSVPPGAPEARWRRYTVRRIDSAASSIDIWVTTDTDGPGAAWASDAAVGDRVEAVGPRGKIALDTDAASHLFVVDLSGVAAMCAMAEALEAPALVATAVRMPPVLGDEHTSAIAPTVADDVVLRHHVLLDDDEPWLYKVLGATIGQLDIDSLAAYVFGELAFTRGVAADLAARGVAADHVLAKPYWRRGRANESNGEPMREEPAGSE